MPGEYLMATRMLIDARHPEETRVAVLKGNRIEEFDFESADHKQIKGNIYLAKVTRVEPSLQAAFVDFGGNRHGFLAFSEIHPDYYQIPAEDRQALLAEEQAAAEEEAALRAEEDEDDDVLTEDQDDSDEDEAGVEEIDTSEKDDVSTIEDGQLETAITTTPRTMLTRMMAKKATNPPRKTAKTKARNRATTVVAVAAVVVAVARVAASRVAVTVAVAAAPRKSTMSAPSARHCAAATRFRTSSSAARCCWSRS